MDILLTGGAGFIGSHVADACIAAGHQVTILDNLSTGREKNLPSQATFHQGDLTDPEWLASVFAQRPSGKPFDAICHHAAQIDVRKSVADPPYDATINIIGGLQLLQLAKKYRVPHFLFASTGGAIYGEPKQLPVSEDHPRWPLSPYGITKLSFEHYLYADSINYGLKTTILRYGNVYGPRQDPLGEAGVIAIFMGKIAAGETCVINGDGKQLRDYIYVGDVAAANLTALEKRITGTFNIGTGIGTSVNDIFTSLKTISQQGNATHGPAKTGEIEQIYLDTTRAQETLGWAPQVTLEAGLTLTKRWHDASAT